MPTRLVVRRFKLHARPVATSLLFKASLNTASAASSSNILVGARLNIADPVCVARVAKTSSVSRRCLWTFDKDAKSSMPCHERWISATSTHFEDSQVNGPLANHVGEALR